jgi:hypothetical protein
MAMLDRLYFDEWFDVMFYADWKVFVFSRDDFTSPSICSSSVCSWMVAKKDSVWVSW